MKKTLVTALLSTAIAIPALSSAQTFQRPQDAVEYRQSAFTLLATHFGAIGGELKKGASADMAAIQKNARLVETLATLPWAGFGPNSKGGKAKEVVWTNHDKFKEIAGQLQTGATALSAAAQEKNLDKISAAFTGLQNSCKACHTDFKDK